MKSTLHTPFLCVVLCWVVAVAGCETPLEFGQVSGTVTLDGRPLDEVRVMFLPDPVAGNQGAHSECITDDQGKYQLVYSQDPRDPGALTGWHRVVVEDTAAENSRDRYRPIRIHASFGSSAQTPLKYEVRPGEQTIDLELGRKEP